MSIVKEKKNKAYNAIYGSDIFNINTNEVQSKEKPKKKMTEQSISPTTQIKLFGKANSFTNIYSNQSIPHKESRPIQHLKNDNNLLAKDELEHIKQRTSYERYLLEFHNTELEASKITNTKGFLTSELKSSQPLTKNNHYSTNRIESLKSNIFNNEQKESDNKANPKENKIPRNNWNTNLDWKNAKSEIILKNHKSSSIAHCQTLDDYYNTIHNQNILNHKFKVFPAEKLETAQLEKECKEQGIHIYNVEKHSDWLNGHGSQLIHFIIRENNLNKFQNNFSKIKDIIEKEKGLKIYFSSCDEISKDFEEKDIQPLTQPEHRYKNVAIVQESNNTNNSNITLSNNRRYLAMTNYSRPLSQKKV